MRTRFGGVAAAALAVAAITTAAWSFHRVLAHRSHASSSTARAASLDTGIRALSRRAADLQARIAVAPRDVVARQQLLLIYQALGDTTRGTEQLEAIARLKPGSQSARLTLANAYLSLGRYPEAEAAYRGTASRWSHLAVAWQGLSAALYHQGRYQEAVQAARGAVRLQPKQASNHYVLAVALLEYAARFPDPPFHGKELREARAELEKLVPLWPGTGDLYLRLGRACLLLRDQSASTRSLERAAALLPGRLDAAVFLSKAYVSSGNPAAARKVVEQSLTIHPDAAELHDALGQLVQSSGEPDADRKALAAFKRAAELEPRNPRLAERLGTAYLRTNDVQQARLAFETAVRLDPNRVFPHQQLAAIYTRLGDPMRATAAARMADRMTANQEQLKQIEALAQWHPEVINLHLILADRYRDLGLAGPSRDEYLFAMRLDPTSARARSGLAALTKRATGEKSGS